FVVAVGLVLGLLACTNPYDPVQRTIGGGLIGAGSGAAIGAAAAGGHGAALGAAGGGAVGAVGGLITTPPPPRYRGSPLGRSRWPALRTGTTAWQYRSASIVAGTGAGFSSAKAYRCATAAFVRVPCGRTGRAGVTVVVPERLHRG